MLVEIEHFDVASINEIKLNTKIKKPDAKSVFHAQCKK